MPQRYPALFRRDVVAVARRGGLRVAEVAADFSVAEKSVRQAHIDEGAKQGVTSAEQAEVVQLRRRLRRLDMENEILRRAAAYFAKDTLGK